MSETPSLLPNLQYVLFCNDLVEHGGQVSAIGLLDGADVRGSLPRGAPVPDKIVFPLKVVLGINAPEGRHHVKLGITRPSGGIMTTVDLEEFETQPDEPVHRCVATLDMEISEDGVYTFRVYLDSAEIGWAVLPLTFTVDWVD